MTTKLYSNCALGDSWLISVGLLHTCFIGFDCPSNALTKSRPPKRTLGLTGAGTTPTLFAELLVEGVQFREFVRVWQHRGTAPEPPERRDRSRSCLSD